MITAIQPVSNVGAYSALASLNRISYLTQGASSSFSTPGTIVNLGTVSSTPLAYNAAGQLETETGTASSALTSNLLADVAAQTLDNIASNPSYANIAAALYMNAAIFRSQHGSDLTPVNTSRSIQPVKELHTIYPV